jgi:alpha-L-rhamnosidase
MRKRRVLLIVISAVCLVAPALTQTDAAKKRPWTAQWIAAAQSPARDESVLHFQKTFDLAEIPQHFRVNISADNQFVLHVNQQRVGTGPSRADLAHWRYETIDLAPYLRVGRNVLAATVWNFSVHAALAQITDRIGFLVQAEDDAAKIVNTDQSWRVEEEKGITTVRPDIRGYFAADPGERLDAAAYDWSWDRESSAGRNWTNAVPLSAASRRGETDSHNNWQLVRDPLPPMEMKLVSAGHVARATGVEAAGDLAQQGITIPPNTSAAILLDKSELTTAYPALSVSGGRGSTVRLTYSEALVDANGDKGNRNQIEGKNIAGITDEFLPAGCSACEFVPLTWRTWRYLQLDVQTADEPLRIESLNAWFTAYPFTERAQFRSDDSSLTDIWNVGWRTARLDAHDTYMDTPYWERLQYVGDTRIQALISYTVAGDDRLARQAIEAYNDSRIPDGLTQSRYPSSLVQMIPTFSLLWVGMVHDFWMYRDDAEFVRAQLPGTRAVLDWYLQRERPDGLLEKLPWWPFVDWGKDFEFGMPPQDEDGGSSIITLQLVEALRNAAELETAVGEASRAAKYRAAANRAAEAVMKLCWNQQYGLLADTPSQRHFSQHANILGVWLDVIPPQKQKIVLARILSASNDAGMVSEGAVPPMTAATYYFRFYLARALEHAGMGGEYLNLLGPWKQMLALGLTTWAESPEPTRSDSHAWSAHPNYDLLTIVAGVNPGSPGFNSVRIEPHLGTLKKLDAAIPIPKGMVQVRYMRSADALDAEVTLPDGISGEIIWNGHRASLHSGKQTLKLQ